MEKNNNLQEQYRDYQMNLAEESTKVGTAALKFIFGLILPMVIAYVVLTIQESFTLRTLGYGIGIIILVICTFRVHRAYLEQKKGFKCAFEWEENLKTYLAQVGADVATLNPPYKEGRQYDAGVQHRDKNLMYRGTADINGTETPLEVRIAMGRVGVYTPAGELMPLS